MPTAALIYPHQLFDPHPAVAGADAVFLVEDPLFFRQYALPPAEADAAPGDA